MRRTLSFLFASALLLVGLALAGFEITHAKALRPFVLIGALVLIGAARGYGSLISSEGHFSEVEAEV